MKNSGAEESKSESLVSHVKADFAYRILLPKNLSARIPWLHEKDRLEAWLFLISPGRFRLLSDDDVQNDSRLEPVRSLILNGPSAAVEPSTADEAASAAIVACLFPTSLTRPKTGWRLSVPRPADALVPKNYGKEISITYSFEGYLEIWYTEVLHAAVREGTDKRS